MTAVAIAVSADVICVDYIFQKLDSMLENIDEFEIIAVNDKNKVIEKYANERNRKLTLKSCNNRVGTRQALATATHAVVFWSGYDLQEIIFVAYEKKLRLKIYPISIASVVNKDAGQQFDVYIGRGTPLGNPYPIEHGTEKDRAHVIERYREYFYADVVTKPDMQRYLQGLRGLRLGCHCKPLSCHGDIIVEYVNSLNSDEEKL